MALPYGNTNLEKSVIALAVVVIILLSFIIGGEFIGGTVTLILVFIGALVFIKNVGEPAEKINDAIEREERDVHMQPPPPLVDTSSNDDGDKLEPGEYKESIERPEEASELEAKDREKQNSKPEL